MVSGEETTLPVGISVVRISGDQRSHDEVLKGEERNEERRFDRPDGRGRV